MKALKLRSNRDLPLYKNLLFGKFQTGWRVYVRGGHIFSFWFRPEHFGIEIFTANVNDRWENLCIGLHLLCFAVQIYPVCIASLLKWRLLGKIDDWNEQWQGEKIFPEVWKTL